MGIQGNDPFYDHTPWFKSIGRSYVFLSNLLVPMSLVRKVAIVGEKGDVKGHLTVSIRYMAGKDDQKAERNLLSLFLSLSLSFSFSPLCYYRRGNG